MHPKNNIQFDNFCSWFRHLFCDLLLLNVSLNRQNEFLAVPKKRKKKQQLKTTIIAEYPHVHRRAKFMFDYFMSVDKKKDTKHTTKDETASKIIFDAFLFFFSILRVLFFVLFLG